VLAAMLFITSCKKENPLNSENSSALSEQQAAPLRVDIMHTTFTIEDANMMVPTGDATLLFDKTGHTLVTAPDGHQVTLGEFNKVSGYAEIKCTNAGTHVVIHLSGLLPKGVYTIWTVTFKSPGFDNSIANVIGVGALGATDGSKNSFTASADGTASLSAIIPSGSLSVFGSVGDCLSSEYQIQLWGVYHMDGLTHGPVPGDDSTWVEQFVIQFMGSQL
jgi:hypothetical protein